ncbi:MAG: alkyl sulfatase dimerization domain-containing protein [Burkholderiaceae bacterium]
MTSDNKRTSILRSDITPQAIDDGIMLVPTQGNGLVVETAKGLVIVDAGPGGQQTRDMIAAVRGLTPSKVRAIVYSHGHIGYNTGVPDWLEHLAASGMPRPDLVAHARVRARFDRYRETDGLQFSLNAWQFSKAPLALIRQGLHHTDPTITFDDEYVFDDDQRPVIVRHSPSETDDSVSVWLPRQKLLWGGPAVINGFPNIGTPLRTQRLTGRWIDTLEKMIALAPTTLVPEFGPFETTADKSIERLRVTADALRFIRSETIRLMNEGLNDVEILHEIRFPDEWRDYGFLGATYGNPDYVVRDVFREQNGWWTSRNVTDLHPAAPDEAATAILSAVDPDKVLARAGELFDAGSYQLCLGVIDLLALAPGDSAPLRQARKLKADCCERLARSTDTFVSRSLYFGGRDAASRQAALARAAPRPRVDRRGPRVNSCLRPGQPAR